MEQRANDQKSLSKDKSKDFARTRKKHLDAHIDDYDLIWSVYKHTLEETIQRYKYLFCTPLFWTHRQEKVLHVLWQHPRGFGWNPTAALMISTARAFPLINMLPFQVAGYISDLEKGRGLHLDLHMPLVRLLNALYNDESNLKPIIYSQINDGEKFLRVETQRLDIVYGNTKYKFLPQVSVYREDTKRSSSAAVDSVDADEAGNFWRMVHLSWTDLSNGARKYSEYGRNFFRHGILEGMSMCECADGASHPHFMPGIFIAMEQKYRRRNWYGQKGEEKDEKKDKRAGARGTPTWQILLTNGPAHQPCAHLYTSRVPGFIVDSFEKPARSRILAPPSYTRVNGTRGGLKWKWGLTFRITHTRIPYMPRETFRQRLRAAITFHRDYFGKMDKGTGKDK
ncbi:hypothetical protein F4680DRAFT_466747 [Xylaria scruposa]|nr:hypothetical protein F4680DRAFT_466747 [Xylaria scruposa]